MGSRTISLKEETYNRLVREKGKDESFSDVVDRLLREEDHALYGLVGLLDEEAVDELRERSRAFRDGVDERFGPRDDP